MRLPERKVALPDAAMRVVVPLLRALSLYVRVWHATAWEWRAVWCPKFPYLRFNPYSVNPNPNVVTGSLSCAFPMLVE